jgi:hypothetical protein
MQAPGPELPSFFGFAFDKNENLLVTEIFGAATAIPTLGASAVSSFVVTRAGGLISISSHIGDEATAACWIALEPRAGKFAYVANNVTGGVPPSGLPTDGSISSYAVGTDGTVTLRAPDAALVHGPNDVATAQEPSASFLYVVEAGTGKVLAFRRRLRSGSDGAAWPPSIHRGDVVSSLARRRANVVGEPHEGRPHVRFGPALELPA